MKPLTVKRGTTVYARERKHAGATTGGTRVCQMEGCTGRRIGVRWSDGSITWPCSKGMIRDEDTGAWEIA